VTRCLLFTLPLLTCLTLLLQAQRIPDDALHTLVAEGIELSGKQRYRAAMARFDEAVRKYPEHPAGFLNKAILYQVMSLDFETPLPAREYLSLLATVQKLGESMSASSSKDWEGQYYQGMSRSYIAYHHFRGGENWLSGLSHGLRAAGFFEKCIERNPEAFDALTALGTYTYWKSRNMRFLTWTPFVSDERQQGIAMLRRAEQQATYTSAQATNALIWIYIEEERWDEAIAAAEAVLRQYPENRLFLWGLASAAEGKERWALAREAYRRIVNSVDGEVRERRYIELQARAKIALMSANLGDNDTASKEASWVLKRKGMSLKPFTSDGAERIKRRIAEVEDMMKELR
jgi:tetratricopeptide (TPR) repeat protein